MPENVARSAHTIAARTHRRVVAEVNRLVSKGIKTERLSLEEEKLLVLLTRLIEDYEHRYNPMHEVAPAAA